MSGISKNVVNSVNRIRASFIDDIGNQCTIQGTGFWTALSNGDTGFITNMHNVNPRIKFGNDTRYALREIALELRRVGDGIVYSTTQFFLVTNYNNCLRFSERADCALLHNPTFDNKPDEFKPVFKLLQSEIADEQFLKDKVQIMDFASFIGFPGDAQSEWWDQYFNFPIARLCSIASLPEIPFKNKAISTEDVTLVSGFSFSGSSGSPVILHEKSIKVSEPLENPAYVPPKIVGIMSGHTIEIPNNEPMFRHTGLSYFTRSTSILTLLGSIQQT
jgi:hypothetical protein